MRRLFLVLLAACGGGDGDANITDANPSDGPSNDAAPGCSVFVSFDPPMPFAFPGSVTRAIANVSNAPGVLSYTWEIKRDGVSVPYTPGAGDRSKVDFPTEIAEAYDVTVKVGGTTATCPVTPHSVNVVVPNANTTQVRVRVYPPPSVAAPPSERFRPVMGGANASLGMISIDPGVVATGNTGARAYLRFVPAGAPDAYVEGFTAASGTFNVRVLNQTHHVLVVPMVPGLAPRRFMDWLPGGSLVLDAGTAISGTVRQGGAAIAGAKVQMTIDGVPTTLTTTDGAGAFTVRASVLAGAATIEVTPPASSGLPRMIASSSAFDFGASIAVAYDPGIVVRDLAGSVVRRGGAPQPDAQVTIVGTLANAGTIAGVTAAGEVRAFATANAGGVLPTLLAPDEQLFAVVSPAPGDFAMSPLDLRAGVPASVDAPAMTPVTTQLRNTTGSALGGAIFEAVPRPPFAMAGVGAVRAIADGAGIVTTSLATGVAYDVDLSDPFGTDGARMAAPLAVANVTATGLASSYALPKAIRIKGTVVLQSSQPVGTAAVQILCAVGSTCVGTERVLPLAQSATTSAGEFAVAVGDPGTM